MLVLPSLSVASALTTGSTAYLCTSDSNYLEKPKCKIHCRSLSAADRLS